MKLTFQQREDLIAARKTKRGERPPKAAPKTTHRLAIDALCAKDPELRRTGMRQAVKARLDCGDGPDEWPDDLEFVGPDAPPWLSLGGLVPWVEIERDLHFVPDAWKIVGKELHCYEVVDTSGLVHSRRDAYGTAWFAFDNHYAVIRLFVYDVHGVSYEADLKQYFYGDTIKRLQRQKREAESAHPGMEL